MKKFLLFTFLFSPLFFCQSINMNINLTDGSTVSFSVNDIQRLEFGEATDIKDFENLKQVIETFKVLQNYPNPFNPSTTITYLIPSTSNVKVCIYDINGQLVKDLLNETQNEGEYKIIWNGTNDKNISVVSGVYIYTVSSNEQIISKQMILLK
ncbi:MAG: T9SS type A sorting domain-containing protein [Ignavibacterium sp.]|nr:T9SS type A sorting domain-containing protein [Ignavibacterium sp.]